MTSFDPQNIDLKSMSINFHQIEFLCEHYHPLYFVFLGLLGAEIARGREGGREGENISPSRTRNFQTLSSAHVNPRPAGVLDFHALLGGVLEHPLLTRLLGHVAIQERRRSKERDK